MPLYYTGSVAPIINHSGDIIRMTKNGGGAFSVDSIDLADAFLGQFQFQVAFVGTRADNSTVTEYLTVTSPSALTTYSFANMTDLVRFEWGQGGAFYHQFDNVGVAAVPEPASMAALALGLAAVSNRRRRRVQS